MALKKEVRIKVHEKFEGRCAYCGQEIKLKDMQVDHIMCQYNWETYIKNNWKIPKFLNHLKIDDLHHIDNLFPACRVCNRWKATFDIEGFRNEISEQINRLNKYSANFRLAKKYGIIEETNIPIKFYYERVGYVLNEQ